MPSNSDHLNSRLYGSVDPFSSCPFFFWSQKYSYIFLLTWCHDIVSISLYHDSILFKKAFLLFLSLLYFNLWKQIDCLSFHLSFNNSRNVLFWYQSYWFHFVQHSIVCKLFAPLKSFIVFQFYYYLSRVIICLLSNRYFYVTLFCGVTVFMYCTVDGCEIVTLHSWSIRKQAT